MMKECTFAWRRTKKESSKRRGYLMLEVSKDPHWASNRFRMQDGVKNQPLLMLLG